MLNDFVVLGALIFVTKQNICYLKVSGMYFTSRDYSVQLVVLSEVTERSLGKGIRYQMAILSSEQPPRIITNYEDAFNSSQTSPDILFARDMHLKIFSLVIHS